MNKVGKWSFLCLSIKNTLPKDGDESELNIGRLNSVKIAVKYVRNHLFETIVLNFKLYVLQGPPSPSSIFSKS